MSVAKRAPDYTDAYGEKFSVWVVQIDFGLWEACGWKSDENPFTYGYDKYQMVHYGITREYGITKESAIEGLIVHHLMHETRRTRMD